MPSRKPQRKAIVRFAKKKKAKQLKARSGTRRLSEIDIDHGKRRNKAVLSWLREALILPDTRMNSKLGEALELNKRLVEEHAPHGKVVDIISAPLERIISGRAADKRKALQNLVASVGAELEKASRPVKIQRAKAA